MLGPRDLWFSASHISGLYSSLQKLLAGIDLDWFGGISALISIIWMVLVPSKDKGQGPSVDFHVVSFFLICGLYKGPVWVGRVSLRMQLKFDEPDIPKVT